MSTEFLAVATWTGTVLSGIGAAVAIRQALLARSLKKQIRLDIRKLNILRCVERLRKSLESVRKLPSDSAKLPRGRQTEHLIEAIKECFDEVLGLLPINGEDTDIRSKIAEAQGWLTAYEHSLNASKLTVGLIAAIQSPIQEAVSLANDRVLKMEGKA